MSDLPRVGTAPCGCGYFDTGTGLAKIHDDKCEFAPKKEKPVKVERPDVKAEKPLTDVKKPAAKKAPAKKKGA